MVGWLSFSMIMVTKGSALLRYATHYGHTLAEQTTHRWHDNNRRCWATLNDSFGSAVHYANMALCAGLD